MSKVATIGLTLAISWLFVAESSYSYSFIRGGKEKVAKLHFYVQDLRIGNANATVFEVAKASVTDDSATDMGSVHVVDDLITAGPEFNSTALGRCQGLTTNADLATYGIAMNLNFYFSAGRFNGSTLSILGRNAVLEERRELPVVGGTGAFRFARGFAIQSTYSIDFDTNYAVLEYTIYTTHNPRFTEPKIAQI